MDILKPILDLGKLGYESGQKSLYADVISVVDDFFDQEIQHCNTDGRIGLTSKRNMLKNKPYLMTIYECILVSL